MDVGLYYLGSFSQVSHLMVNTHHRVKKKPAGEKYKGKKHQGAASRHIRLGRSHSGPPAVCHRVHKAMLHCSDDTLVGFLTEPSGWEVLQEFTSHVTFLRKLL